MDNERTAEPAYMPRSVLDSLASVDREAGRVRAELGWLLAAFLAVFDEVTQNVLVVQLGGYARSRYGGNPWTLPGGSVEPQEQPSQGICREVREEAGLPVDEETLKLAAWLPRPYFRPHNRDRAGELLLLFSAIGDPDDLRLRPNPPETIGATFYPFSLSAFLAVPSSGTGEHPLQPLPRHWAYWARVGQVSLQDQLRAPLVHVYSTAADLAQPPWPLKAAPAFEAATT